MTPREPGGAGGVRTPVDPAGAPPAGRRVAVRPRRTPRFTDTELARISAELERLPASKIVQWAVDTFGDGLCLTTSMTDTVLLDVALRVDPGIEVVFVDTGYHFPETLMTLGRAIERYRPRLVILRADEPLDDRWMEDPDGCCGLRKVRPLDEHLAGRTAWLSGLRRADGPTRAGTPVVSRDRRGLVKVNPLATWTDEDVEAYIAAHDLIVNPLVEQGYPSIGCWPCTRPVREGEDKRAGRWTGFDKTECGLHL